MEIKPLNNNADYLQALGSIECLFDNEPKQGSQEGIFFETMLSLIEDYEQKMFHKDFLKKNLCK